MSRPMRPDQPVPSAEVYPGAPLRAVAIEAYFAPLLDAHARLGHVQRRHAQEYDRLVYPWDREIDPSFDRPRPALLMGVGRKRALAFAADQVATITYEYPGGFAAFTGWAYEILVECLDALDVSTLNRVSFRYENMIEVGASQPADRRGVDLSTILKVNLAQHASAGSEIRNVHLYWSQVWPGGGVDVSIDSADTTRPGVIDLSISAECDGPFPRTELESRVAEAHRMARLTFEEMITDEYRERLRAKHE